MNAEQRWQAQQDGHDTAELAEFAGFNAEIAERTRLSTDEWLRQQYAALEAAEAAVSAHVSSNFDYFA